MVNKGKSSMLKFSEFFRPGITQPFLSSAMFNSLLWTILKVKHCRRVQTAQPPTNLLQFWKVNGIEFQICQWKQKYWGVSINLTYSYRKYLCQIGAVMRIFEKDYKNLFVFHNSSCGVLQFLRISDWLYFCTKGLLNLFVFKGSLS